MHRNLPGFDTLYRQDLVAMSWDADHVLLLGARRRGKAVEMLGGLHLLADSGTQPSEVGSVMTDQIRRWGMRRPKLLVGIPRSWVEIISMHLPPANERELPDFVRHEVARRLPDLPQDFLMDFQATESRETGQHDVEAAVLRADSQRQLHRWCGALGLRPSRIVMRPYAMAALFERLTGESQRRCLLLSLLSQEVDMSILDGGKIVFSRSLRSPSATDSLDGVRSLADEIRRTLAVVPWQGDVERPVERVFMFGDIDDQSGFIKALADDLDLPVSVLDPCTGVKHAEGADRRGVHRYAALIGMVHDALDTRPTIDFANPKKPPAPPRYGRKALAYSAAALLVATILGYSLNAEVSQLREENDQLAVRIEKNQQLFTKIRSKTMVVDAVRAWQFQDVHWLDELRHLSQRFPPADQAVVGRMTMAPAARGGGVVSMSVKVTEPSIVGVMEGQLRDEYHQVSSQRISHSDSEERFSCQFETSIAVVPRTADETAKKQPEKTVSRAAPDAGSVRAP